MSKEALKLALEALESWQKTCLDCGRSSEELGRATKPITAIKEALAQPEQKLDGYVQKVIDALYENSDPVSVEAAELLEHMAQSGLKPVAWINWCAATGKRSVSFECESELASQPLYSGITQITQDRYSNDIQQRKPLTDEMRKQMKERCDSMEMRGAFADGWMSSEAAHGIKEKNNG